MENNNFNISYNDIIADIRRATVDSKHPYRYAGLSTVNKKYGVQSRTVVLRKLKEDNQLYIFTDSRTGKVEDLQHDNRLSILCYNPRSQQQLRIQGKATIITSGEDYNQCLEIAILRNQRDYNTALAPGSKMGQGLKVERQEKLSFSLLSIDFHYLEYLKISRGGHVRIGFEKKEGRWVKEILIP